MMNANQYQQNAYYQNAPPYPKPYPPPPQPPQNQSSNVPNGHWPQPQQMSTVQTPGKKPQYQAGPPMEQQQPQPPYHSSSHYPHPNAYYQQRPMHSPNLQQYPTANVSSPQPGRPYNPAQHPNHRFNNSYPQPNSAYRTEQEVKNYAYPQANNYDSTRPPPTPYNQQNNAFTASPANMSYPQRQYIEPRTYGNSLNSETNRMRYPVNYNAANYNNQARLPISNVTVSPHSMAAHRPTATSQTVIPLRSPSLNVNDPTLVKREPNDKHLRQALSNIYSGTKENKIDMVESTKPIIKRLKPLTNIGNADHRKILMSLKSGLLAETTWAFDCLNIISNNGTLKLASIPSLLSNLMDYYKCFLNLIFDDLFADTENDYQLKIIKNDYLASKEEFDNLIQTGEKVFLLDSTNYTFKSRNGLPVEVKTEPCLKSIRLHAANDLSKFEETCDYSYFQDGNGLPTAHIISTLDSIEELRSFINGSQDIEDKTSSPSDHLKKCKRKLEFDTEAELQKSDTTLCPRRESIESLLKRCHCISTIIRNVSFLPENAQLMAQSSALLLVLARLLSFNHLHLEKKTFAIILYDSENKTQEKENLEASEIFYEFPFDMLHMIRLNTFVTLSNMSEFLDLSQYSDKIILPLLDSLLHWAVCQSSYAKDTHPPDGLSFQLLVLEILVKLSMKITNIDLILATPPFSRLEELYKILVRSIGKEEDQVLRELSLVILSNFAQADLLSARIILHLDYSIFNLLTFIEQSEFTKRTQIYNRFNMVEPFTIAYMLIHAATTLRTLASECERKDLHLIKRHEDRIVDLIMSHLLESEVTNILADLIFILSRDKTK